MPGPKQRPKAQHQQPKSSLTRNQQTFARAFAQYTGLNPRVVGAWLLSEQSGGAARGYEKRKYNNWLNIARTDSGDRGGAHAGYWRDPVTAARVSAQWMRGRGPIAKDYGKPAAGITAILGSHNKGTGGQISAISRSGWASSGYNGGSDLRQLLGQAYVAPGRVPGGGGGGGGQGQPRKVTVPNPAPMPQIADIRQTLQQDAQQNAGGRTIDPIPAPDFSAENYLPQGDPLFQPPDVEPQAPANQVTVQDALNAIQPQKVPLPQVVKAAISGGGQRQQRPGGGPAMAPGARGYASPVRRGQAWGKVDEGLDFGSGPNFAVGSGRIEKIHHNFYKGLPYIVLKLDHPVRTGGRTYDRVYYSEQLHPHVKEGQRVKAGQHIATTYGSNEIGFSAGPEGHYLPYENKAAHGSYSEGQQTPAAKHFARFIRSLKHGRR